MKMTMAQIDVVCQLAQGKTLEQIARTSKKSLGWINREIHIAKLVMEANTLPHLVAKCIRSGILEMRDIK